MGEVKLIPVYYKSTVTGWGCACCLHAVVGEGKVLKESIVTGWGYACCLHTVVGEGKVRKELLNLLPGPKSRSTVCGYVNIFSL